MHEIQSCIAALSDADKKWRIPNKNYKAIEVFSLNWEQLLETEIMRIIENQHDIRDFVKAEKEAAELTAEIVSVEELASINEETYDDVFSQIAADLEQVDSTMQVRAGSLDDITKIDPKAHRNSSLELASFQLDPDYYATLLNEEVERINNALTMIDHFHTGVLGSEKLIWDAANIARYGNVEMSLVERMFNSVTGDFEPYSEIQPPILMRFVASDGGFVDSEAIPFDRDNPFVMKQNFYRGVNSSDKDQNARFSRFNEKLEEISPDIQWDDKASIPLLAGLEEAKTRGKGRPKGSSLDDTSLLSMAKINMLQYSNGDNPERLPSRNSVLTQLVEHYSQSNRTKDEKKNQIKRLDLKLKRKLQCRGFPV